MHNRQLTRDVDITAFRAGRTLRKPSRCTSSRVTNSASAISRSARASSCRPTRSTPSPATSFRPVPPTSGSSPHGSSVEFGSFFSGDRQEVVVNLSVRPRPGVLVNLQNEWNRIDLPEGRFETRVFRVIADTQFSPWIYLVNNVQFDSVSANIGWQSRLRWILEPRQRSVRSLHTELARRCGTGSLCHAGATRRGEVRLHVPLLGCHFLV